MVVGGYTTQKIWTSLEPNDECSVLRQLSFGNHLIHFRKGNNYQDEALHTKQ